MPEVRALCSAGITRPHSSYGPVRRPRGPSPKVTLRARPSSPPGLPRLPVSLFQRAVPSTPADQDGCTCRLLPRPARPSPDLRRVGIRDFTFEACSGFTRTYGPLDRSTAQGGLCHRASIHPVTRTNRLPATRSNRQLSGWFLPPLVIRAFWAHVESRRGAVAWALWASLRFLSPLIKPDVRISRIRLPDRLHLKAHGGGPRWTRLCRITPSSPNTTVSGKPGATRRHLMAPDQEMTYSLVRSSSLIPDNQFGSPAPPSP